ncbi:MAG: hypothetical protein CSYNP_03649 [Syntrophus sp. SKADARSKE-3]|nr:hypothetical protein [Syntrophus sp. SKADARSKE-3]
MTDFLKPAKDRYITVHVVAERLSCSEQHIRDLIIEGSLIAIKVGSRAIRVSEQSLIEFIETNRVNPEDLFDPDLEKKEPPVQNQVSRSNWMSKV